jgi:hypothetical protein
MGTEDKKSDRAHHLAERAKDTLHEAGEHLKDAAERLGEVPGEVGERTLAAAKAGENLVDKLTEKARRQKDTDGH